MFLPSRSVSRRIPAPLIAVLVGAFVAGGCGSGERETPLATIAVTPARSRVVIGGPLELTYRFAVQPETSLAANYSVFVHLVDADGRVVWNGDHLPAVPTSTWKPGQTIEYHRTSFLPTTGLVPGTFTLLAGLYRDERLPLQGGIGPAQDRAYPVATLQLAPETERVFLVYTNGWHSEEHNEAGTESWTWTTRVGSLAFKNPRTDLMLYLEYDARPDAFAGQPQRVTVTVAGQVVASFLAESDARRLEQIDIPAAALGTTEMADIRIEVDRTFVPAALAAGGRDERELGIRVYHAFAERR